MVHYRTVMGFIYLEFEWPTERQFDWLNPSGAIDSMYQLPVVVDQY